MNPARSAIAVVVALVLVGSLHWAGRPDSGAETYVSALPPSAALAGEDKTRSVSGPLTVPPAESKRDGESERVRRLVDEMRDLMRRAEGLSGDDIGEFESLANLTNEFENGLDREKAALLVRHMPPGFLATPWGDLALRRWAREDRASAAAWMAANPDPSPVAAAALMHGWFAEDKVAARDYVAGLPDGPWKTHAATSAAEEALVAEEPVELLDFLSLSQGENPRREELQEWAAIMWGKNNYTEAIAWASGAAEVSRRERLVAAVNVGYANTDPLAAAEDLLARVKSADSAAPALGSIVRIWSAREPVAAAQWVAAFPAGPEKTHAIRQLLEIWVPADRGSATRWQQSLADPVARLQAEAALVAIEAEIEEPLRVVRP